MQQTLLWSIEYFPNIRKTQWEVFFQNTTYVVQNYFCAKLFTHIEIVCNHTSLSYKSTENDHALSVYFSTIINSEEINLKTTGNLDGYWSNNTLGSDSFYKRLLPTGDSTSVGEVRRHHPEVQARELGATDYVTTDSHGAPNNFGKSDPLRITGS